MKNIFLTSIIAMMVSCPVFASDVKLFVGANLAINSISWSEDVDKEYKNMDINLPDSSLGLGAEIGARLKNNNIYNPGITLSYDYAFDSAADIKSSSNQAFNTIEFGFSAISATFDNYIRFSGNDSKRSDFVFGIGLANATERFNVRFTPYGKSLGLVDEKGKDDGRFVVLKTGLDFEISEKIDFLVNGRWFVPTKSGGDVDVMFNLNAGLRYVF